MLVFMSERAAVSISESQRVSSPPNLVPRGRRKRDPGNEVGFTVSRRYGTENKAIIHFAHAYVLVLVSVVGVLTTVMFMPVLLLMS